MPQKFVRFWIDFVRFLPVRAPQDVSKVKTDNLRRSVIYGLFRRHLSLVPPSSIGGKVTAERLLDDVGKGVSNVWNECK